MAADADPRSTIDTAGSPAPYVLTIDIGSSSVRASVIGADGATLPRSDTKVTHELRYTAEGAGELDPEALLDKVATVVDGTLEETRRAGITIDAVAADTIWHSVCGVDASGEVTFPVLTWAERRPAGVTGELRRRLDDLEQHRRTGARLHAVFLPAKLLWLSQDFADAFDHTVRFLSPGEFVYSRLFGDAHASVSMASGTGLFDQHALRWDEEVLGALPIERHQLPEVSDEPATGLRDPWRSRWPELADIPWFPAVGDGATSNIGCGCVDRSRLALMVGTSGAMRMVWPAETVEIPDALWCYRADAARFVMGGALSDGGNLVAWMRRTLRLPDAVEVERLILERPAGAHGLNMLPTFAGERGPAWSDSATGALVGLSHATTAVDLLHATLEAIALRFALVSRVIAQSVPGDREIVATGAGMLASPAWRQVMADALGAPLVTSAVDEASARGAAMMVLERLGAISSLADLPAPVGAVARPRADRHERYAEMLQRQVDLYERLVGDGQEGAVPGR